MLKLIIGNKAYSSWSMRGWLACKQSGLPFVDLDKGKIAPSILQRVPKEQATRLRLVPLMEKDGRFVVAVDDPATAQELSSTIDDAHRMGAFGVPTFVAGKEMFWGNDRMVLLRHFLAQDG